MATPTRACPSIKADRSAAEGTTGPGRDLYGHDRVGASRRSRRPGRVAGVVDAGPGAAGLDRGLRLRASAALVPGRGSTRPASPARVRREGWALEGAETVGASARPGGRRQRRRGRRAPKALGGGGAGSNVLTSLLFHRIFLSTPGKFRTAEGKGKGGRRGEGTEHGFASPPLPPSLVIAVRFNLCLFLSHFLFWLIFRDERKTPPILKDLRFYSAILRRRTQKRRGSPVL